MFQRDDNKTPADNGRFCEMAAVTPQKVQCEIGSYYPAGSVVEAATSQSRWDVMGKFFGKIPPYI